MAFDIEHELRLATDHHQNGRLAEAESIYKHILALDPNQPDALHLLGVLAAQTGHPDQAITLIRRAIVQIPDSVYFHLNLAMILEQQGAIREAATTYAALLPSNPQSADYYYKFGNTLRLLGQMDQATHCYREAIRLNPSHVPALNNLGNALKQLNQLDEAILHFQSALRIAPDDVSALVNLAGTLLRLARHAESIACHRRALELNPQNAIVHSSLLLALQYDPQSTPEMLHREARVWAERHEAPLAHMIRPCKNNSDPNRPLRIGYVSSDFMDSPSVFFLRPLLASHDPSHFEIFCYSNVFKPDAYTAAMRPLARHWRDIANLSDDDAARLIRDDQIDILVDLKLHTLGNRLLLFARKPAPIQVTWLGYPGTTGMSAIDYRLSDAFLDPTSSAGQSGDFYSEKTIRLPGSFWCYDPFTEKQEIEPIRIGAPQTITFGCFNAFTKINDPLLQLWARVLNAVPDAHLTFTVPEGSASERVLHLFQAHGISGGRLNLVNSVSRREYLERYRHVDICLDTFPYNGHTTTIDALWMGVPVITLVGNTPPGRGGVSILSNAGLADLIAQTPEEFIRIAIQLAGDKDRLALLRRTLRERIRQSPLMDARQFARNFENAYRDMWRHWCSHP